MRTHRYILFMPTFVSFFSAYSTNRLADVSWGQRAVEDGVENGQQRIETTARHIGVGVIVLNLCFACTMTTVRLLSPDSLIVVANVIMAPAGCTFVISFVSYVYLYCRTVVRACCTDQTQNTGLGEDSVRAFDVQSGSDKTIDQYRQRLLSGASTQLV